MADGPEAGLRLVEPLGPSLDGYHLFHATRADLLRRLGHADASEEAYRRALELAPSEAERRFLRRRLAGL
jgi:RNA polymerase sigma-70 factor (ECF subfamily)